MADSNSDNFNKLQRLGERNTVIIKHFVKAIDSLGKLERELQEVFHEGMVAVALMKASLNTIEISFLEIARKELSEQASQVNMEELIEAMKQEAKKKEDD